jgi:peptidoglycan/LPS O-acetylase OafA/YrhL
MTELRADLPSASHWPALDGLRGLAILMVFGFHLPFGPFRAGSYGVILFFVLSGFLITTILLRELDQTAGVNLRRFYGRRARRLLPALLLVVIGHLIIQLTILGDPQEWWGRTWPVLAYISNYAEISGTPLFHMTHTWSLAVEEHFYFLWPLLLLAVPRRWQLRATCGLALALVVWRLGFLLMGVPRDRIYFGTDTNAFAPLVGCALAMLFHQRRLPTPGRNVSALSAAVLILVACIPWQYDDRRLLYGAIPVAMLSAGAIYGALLRPALWLENPVLRWFGKISYGLYLWHYLIISLPWEQILPIPPSIPMIAVPIALAGLSWRLVEAPLLGRKPAVRHSLVAREPVVSTPSPVAVD